MGHERYKHWLPIQDCDCKEARTEVHLSLCDNHDARVIRAIQRGTIREEFTPARNAAEAEELREALGKEPAMALTAVSPPEIRIPAGYSNITIKHAVKGTKIFHAGITIELT